MTLSSIRLFLIWSSVLIVHAQTPIYDCRLAPPEFQAQCYQLQRLDAMARQNIQMEQRRRQSRPPVFAPNIPGAGFAPAVPRSSYAPTPYDCMDLQCLCPHFRGNMGGGGVCMLPSGFPLRMAVRKEFRMLSDDERFRYNSVLQRMKSNGEYDRFAAIHRDVGTSSGAHSGPSFLPWHREFLKRVEIAMRLIDPSIAIPYWDSVLDSYLPDPRDSILLSSVLMGDIDASGFVVNGPYAGFRTLEGNPFISRRPGAEGRLFTERSLNDVYSQNRIEFILAYTAPQNGCPYPPNYGALEYTHGSVHNWVGGDMKPVVRSANDPIFYLLHSFVDYIWEQWRQMRQNRFQREQDFSPDLVQCENPQHFSNAIMRPFSIINRQGLSNAYTDFLYAYAPRPTCNAQTLSCGSKFIFCDVRNGPPHCVSKVKLNGLCRGFEGEDACYGGTCIGGYCRAVGPQPMQAPMQIVQNPQMQFRRGSGQFARTFNGLVRRTWPGRIRTMAAKTATCFNDDPCCSIWAKKGECGSNENYMNEFCKRSCGFCKTKDDDREGCFDRHIACPYFETQGDCTKRRQWMAENCQKSCKWCDMDQEKLCLTTARMSRM